MNEEITSVGRSLPNSKRKVERNERGNYRNPKLIENDGIDRPTWGLNNDWSPDSSGSREGLVLGFKDRVTTSYFYERYYFFRV